MFKGMGDLAGLMQQARQAQARMKEVQDRLASQRVTGSSGGGMVTVEMDGQQVVSAVRIEPSLVEGGDVDLLADLVRSATNDAHEKSLELAQQEMSEVMGGLNVPGLGEMFGNLGNQPDA